MADSIEREGGLQIRLPIDGKHFVYSIFEGVDPDDLLFIAKKVIETFDGNRPLDPFRCMRASAQLESGVFMRPGPEFNEDILPLSGPALAEAIIESMATDNVGQEQ